MNCSASHRGSSSVRVYRIFTALSSTDGSLPPFRTAILRCAAAISALLLPWNCKHIANAAIRRAVEQQCRLAGYEPPVICTPQELLER